MSHIDGQGEKDGINYAYILYTTMKQLGFEIIYQAKRDNTSGSAIFYKTDQIEVEG